MTNNLAIQVNSILGFDEEWSQRFRRLATFLETIAEFSSDDIERCHYYALEARLRFAWTRYKRDSSNDNFTTFHQVFVEGWRYVQIYDPVIEPPAYYKVLAGAVELGYVYAQGVVEAIKLIFARYGGPVIAVDGSPLTAVKV